MTERRINNEPGFILHTWPFKETSLVAEAFTVHHGRVALVARGARRPRSASRGLIQPFTALLLSWFGKHELRTLREVEWQGGLVPLQGEALMCGFYLNELLLKLLPRDDPHEALFDHYRDALRQLGEGTIALEVILRRFEAHLLAEIGYAATFSHEAETRREVEAAARYVFQAERGAYPYSEDHPGVAVSGQTLLDLAEDRFGSALTLQEAKRLMRYLIAHHLGGKPLYTRKLLVELNQSGTQ
ncbi:MAG TPA: DNA repair protein RecO [Thiobacillaceae bacterium]|nr:DNA repair protein RecO [Thiobacillaceae bacterium]